VDETSATVIADDLVRPRFAGQLERIGVSKIDRGSMERFVEAQWWEGELRIPGASLDDVVRDVARLPCRPRWVVTYIAYGSEFKGGLTCATAYVDDEAGSAEWEDSFNGPVRGA
jgi:hypothetical protein